MPSHTATIRRKPSSKPPFRRGTISGGVPIPISTPQVPLKPLGGTNGSDENVFKVPSSVGLGHSKLCTSTQSLSALPPSSSPYYQIVPGQMPIPVPIPTVPSLPSEGGNSVKQQQQRQYQQHQQYSQPQQQHNQQFQIQQFQQQQQIQQQQIQQQQIQQQQFQQQKQIQQQQFQQWQQIQQQFQHQQQQQQQFQQPQIQQAQQLQPQHDQYQLQLNQQQKQKLFQQQQQQHQAYTTQAEPSGVPNNINYQPQAPPPSSQDQNPEQVTLEEEEEEEGDGGGNRNMLTLLRGVKLRRTITNDRSAPLLPPPTNHKWGWPADFYFSAKLLSLVWFLKRYQSVSAQRKLKHTLKVLTDWFFFAGTQHCLFYFINLLDCPFKFMF